MYTQADGSALLCTKITDFVTSKSSIIWLVLVSEQTGYSVTLSQILTIDLYVRVLVMQIPGPEVIKIKHSDWLLVDTCP